MFALMLPCMITRQMRKQWGVIAAVIFTAALAIAGGFLIFDAFYRAPLQHALMNVEGIIALELSGPPLHARARGRTDKHGGPFRWLGNRA